MALLCQKCQFLLGSVVGQPCRTLFCDHFVSPSQRYPLTPSVSSAPTYPPISLLISQSKYISTAVTIRLLPIANAPPLKQKIFKVSASNRFETVVNFLSKKLNAIMAAEDKTGEATRGKDGGKNGDSDEGFVSVFCYVNSVFAPGLDEGVGGLWRVSCLLFLSVFGGLEVYFGWG